MLSRCEVRHEFDCAARFINWVAPHKFARVLKVAGFYLHVTNEMMADSGGIVRAAYANARAYCAPAS